MHWRYCVRKCQDISAEKWLIPTQIISSVHFVFLLVYSWTYGGRASTTEIVLISWCLSYCSAVLILPGATISVSPLPPSMPWKRKNGCLVRTHFVNSPKRFWAWIQRFCSPPPCPTPIPQAWLPSMAELPGLTGRVHSKAWLCKEAHKLVCGSSFYVQVASWPWVAIPLVPLLEMISHQLLKPVGRSGEPLLCGMRHQFTVGLCAECSIWASLSALVESTSWKININYSATGIT